jgi:hypothetical protein
LGYIPQALQQSTFSETIADALVLDAKPANEIQELSGGVSAVIYCDAIVHVRGRCNSLGTLTYSAARCWSTPCTSLTLKHVTFRQLRFGKAMMRVQ